MTLSIRRLFYSHISWSYHVQKFDIAFDQELYPPPNLLCPGQFVFLLSFTTSAGALDCADFNLITRLDSRIIKCFRLLFYQTLVLGTKR
jgi:hypothetical protein